MADDDTLPLQLLVALAGAKEQSGSLAALRQPKRAQPQAGDIWRVRWDRTVEVVLVLDVSVAGDSINAMPLLLDEGLADEQCRELPAEATTFGVSCAVVTDASRWLPRFVLDEHLAEANEAASVTQARLEQDYPAGIAFIGALDDRRPRLAAHRGAMQTLAVAGWANSGSGNLRELLGDRGIGVPDLVRMLGRPAPSALSLLRGKSWLAVSEAQALATSTGLGVEDLLAGNPAIPPALQHEAADPAFRSTWDELARRRELNDALVRLDYVSRTYALAARQSHGPEHTIWRERLSHVLGQALDETAGS